ncbi:MAG: SH3 domain-containing protein, partial [Chloroflexota bacterium]
MKRMRLFTITLLGTLLLLSTALTSAQGGIVATTTDDVWIRVGPGTDWRGLDVLPEGTNINLDGRDTFNGVWVRGISQDGLVGWMSYNYLNISAEQAGTLPPIEREAPITVGAPGPGPGTQAAAPPADTSEASAPADTAAPAAAPATVSSLTTNATANVNMRSGPGIGFSRVGGALFNETLTLDGRNGDLTWVRGVSSNGVLGWVSSSFIAATFNEISGLPIIAADAPTALDVSAPPAPADTTAASAPAAAPIIANTPITGFSYGGHVRGLDDNTVNYMRSAGMTWAKYQVRYGQGADPNGVAGLINDAHGKGFRILLGVVGSPNELGNAGYDASYASFVGGLAALGADAIEVWNESNLDREWPTGQIDPVRYTQLLAASYNSIKANNPNTYVISAAMAPTGAEAAFPGRVVNDNTYLSGMVAAGALNYLDCVGAHYNEGIVPPTQNSGDPRGEYYTRYYDGMVNTYWNIIGGQRPICFTELGYLTPE